MIPQETILIIEAVFMAAVLGAGIGYFHSKMEEGMARARAEGERRRGQS